ncbi:hypothetical protein PAMA_003112 [Pampus argenteus]
MATKTQLGWQKLFLILTVLPCCRSLQVSISQAEYEVASGGEITMTCSFIPATTTFNLLILTWEYHSMLDGDIWETLGTYYYTANPTTNIAPAYEGRAFLEVDIAKQVSTLHLTKVTMQDNGNFGCNVKIPDDDEGTTSATTSLLVLVPPSVPLCNIQGKAEYWQNISLTCMSEQGSPTPIYDWKSYSVENIAREFPPKTTEKDGVLSLFNISKEMSGFYICTSTNRIGSASCNFTLAVVPGSMNIGATAGIIGGVLAGVLCLGILIFCCCRRKSKKYDEGSPGDVEFYDRDTPEAGEQFVDQYEDKAVAQNSYSAGTAGHKFEDDQHSYGSGKERHDGKGSDTDTPRYQDDQHDHYRGSRDRLDDKYDRSSGSRDRLDDQRDRYGGSRDRLDDHRDRYGGSRDRLDDHRDRYGGSRDRLDDHRDRYGGSRDRLDDHQERYGGSRDRLDDQRERYAGSRDRLDDQRERYAGSRDRLDDQRERYGGSRDRLDDQRDHNGGRYNEY